MAVDTQTWRTRIGLFQNGRSSSGILHVSRNIRERGQSCSLLPLLLVCALLVIGCVELNPGPEFKCGKCPLNPTFSTLGESALHQKKVHLNDKNFSFTCQWPSCGFQFSTYDALNVHIIRLHQPSRHIPQVLTTPLQCNVDGCECEFPSSRFLCHHLMRFHQQQDGVRTQCPFKDVCKSKHFFPLASFKTHLSQKHAGWKTSFDIRTSLDRVSSPSLENNEVSEDDNENEYGFDHDSFHAENEQNPTDNEEVDIGWSSEADIQAEMKKEFVRNLAMFYLRLESQHHIPASTIQVIADGIAELTRASKLIVKRTILNELDNLNIKNNDQREKVTNSILYSDCLFSCHESHSSDSFRTNALRKKYYRQHFRYIKPKEINLSKDVDEPRCIYYVPVKETLEILLTIPLIKSEIIASFTRFSEPGIIADYTDGSLYQERLSATGEKTIDILLYQDQFTGTKDLSSVADDNDVLGMYMTIGNLRPYLRSKLDCIQLVMLIPSFKKIFKDFKVKCFHKVMKDLRVLEREGINFLNEKVKIRLQFLLADNKGQHEIGGFIQSFSSEYFCRFCTMTKTDIKKGPWVVGPLRTRESYENAMRCVPADRATYMGVSRPEFCCPFNKLDNFHVCDPSLAPCLAHDIFEGILNFDLAPIIKNLIEIKKWSTYEIVNRRIKKFKFGNNDSRNKPAPLKFGKKKKDSSDAEIKQHPGSRRASRTTPVLGQEPGTSNVMQFKIGLS